MKDLHSKEWNSPRRTLLPDSFLLLFLGFSMARTTFCFLALIAAAFSFTAREAAAVPELQIYIEGATYDSASETWVATSTSPFRLWVIGNVAGEGGKGPLYDVKLAAAYNATDSVTLG